MSAKSLHQVAVLTPPGAGAIALIRISGDNPAALVDRFFSPIRGGPIASTNANRLRYGHFKDGKEILDDLVAVAHVVNGRHCVDLTVHGGVRVVERIVGTLNAAGAEWMDRATDATVWPSAHRLDAEIVAAMTDAPSERSLRFLAAQRFLLPTALQALADIATTNPQRATAELLALQSRYHSARALLRGVSVALVGPPNSGKSTLFNALLGRPAAVVSDIAGTTRDWITESILLEGVSATLLDTAGRHEATTPLEVLAIEAGQKMAEDADLRILVLDATDPGTDPTALKTHSRAEIVVANKCDGEVIQLATLGGIPLSAKTGRGLSILTQEILRKFDLLEPDPPTATFFFPQQLEWSREIQSLLADDPATAADLIRSRLAPLDS